MVHIYNEQDLKNLSYHYIVKKKSECRAEASYEENIQEL